MEIILKGIRNRKNQFYWIFLVVIPLGIYYFEVFSISLNIPIWDEYDLALVWMGDYLGASFQERLTLLLSKSNEHRLVPYRLAVLIDYLIFGEINFRHLIILGNIGLIGLAFVIFKLNPIFKKKPLLFVPVILLIFIPQHEIIEWGVVAISIIYLYIFVITSLFFLNKKGNGNFTISIILAIMATFSFGNGMFVFFAGFIVMFLSQRKSTIHKLIWSIVMIISITLYFSDYIFFTEATSSHGFIIRPVLNLQIFLTYFVGFLSPVLKHSPILFSIVGLVVLVYLGFLFLFKWQYMKNNPVSISILFFVLLTGASLAISRVGFGIIAASAPRYILLQVIFISVLYIISIDIYKDAGTRVFNVILFASFALYGIRLYGNIQRLKMDKMERTNGLTSYFFNPNNTSLDYPNQKKAASILDISIKSGYYKPEEFVQFDLKNKEKK